MADDIGLVEVTIVVNGEEVVALRRLLDPEEEINNPERFALEAARASLFQWYPDLNPSGYIPDVNQEGTVAVNIMFGEAGDFYRLWDRTLFFMADLVNGCWFELVDSGYQNITTIQYTDLETDRTATVQIDGEFASFYRERDGSFLPHKLRQLADDAFDWDIFEDGE